MTWDRMLAFVGLLLGIIGIIIPFLNVGIAYTLTLLTVSMLALTFAYYWQFFTNLPPYSIRSVEVTLVLEDDEKATLTKDYKIRANYNHLDRMLHRNIASDGSVENICWDNEPIPANQITKILGEYEVDVHFDNVCKRWRVFPGSLSYDLIKSFSDPNREGIYYNVDFPIKSVRIRICLPENHPCKGATAYRIIGIGKIPIKDPDISHNNCRIELEVSRPRVGIEIAIFWTW